MADYESTVNQIKEDIEKAKNMKIRAEARLEQLEKQKRDILAEIESLGVKPENLGDEIKRLKNEIEKLIEKAKSMLPVEFSKSN